MADQTPEVVKFEGGGYGLALGGSVYAGIFETREQALAALRPEVRAAVEARDAR